MPIERRRENMRVTGEDIYGGVEQCWTLSVVVQPYFIVPAHWCCKHVDFHNTCSKAVFDWTAMYDFPNSEDTMRMRANEILDGGKKCLPLLANDSTNPDTVTFAE